MIADFTLYEPGKQNLCEFIQKDSFLLITEVTMTSVNNVPPKVTNQTTSMQPL